LEALRGLSPQHQNRPRVLIVQSNAALSDHEYTSYGSRGGSNLAAHYAPYASVHVVDASFERAREALISGQPALVHLVASVRETGGIVFLDLARRRNSSEGGPLPTTALDTVVKRVYESSARPFLVLDIVRPSSTFDAALALSLRNSFASDLLHLGAFSGILATGLEQPRMLGGIAAAIEQALQKKTSMGSLAKAIRELYATPTPQPNMIDTALAYLGTALFAQDPDLPCLPF
jgi:hypothetical protein